ncbi:translation initiation factor IF-3 [Peptoniphilus harei ACS-146-V-Sch2b]|uniref:Translation initiation factor IF-3 n=2 Tax=Peptoniphilaceae TaxID=1570339 RepID=E4KYS3_9FIRM|nr:translation initiation factor IF-3 [Peptoniphilus harei ACS-146-V-Sch2b]
MLSLSLLLKKKSASHLMAQSFRLFENYDEFAGIFLGARFFNLRRCLEIKELQINEEIREKEVRLVDDEGNQLGVVSRNQAIDLAISKKLDLVNVAPNAKPPVCRIMDYGKYRYEQEKKEKEARKKQKVINVKELRFSPNIEDHDLNTKANRAIDFLKNGDRVKVSVRFRGREMGHTDLGREVLDKFYDLISEYGVVDKKPKMEGRSLVMFLSERKDSDKSDN